MGALEEQQKPDEFPILLAACDRALLEGKATTPNLEAVKDEDLRARLEKANDFLKRVHNQWPRQAESLASASSEDQVSAGVPLEGATFDRFRLLRVLGQGGFGIVYLAMDPKLGRKVALKVPRPETLLSASLRDRFLQEARAVARLNHPNIVALFESGEVGPICYLVSAYCPGKNLACWLKEQDQPVPPITAAKMVAQLADAVQHAHDCGVLHRDLKPANILLQEPTDDRPPNTDYCPRITDFGLARLLDCDSSFTQSNLMAGTPVYMAPEQADGKRDLIGKATDIYGLGVLLYEMLAGRPPFQAHGVLETLRQVSQEDPPPIVRWRSDIPRDLEAICFRCLAKKPGERYASAGNLAQDLRRYVNGQPTWARPSGPWDRMAKWTRRRPALAGLLGLLAVLLVTLPAALRWHYWEVNTYIADLSVSAQRADESAAGELRARDLAYAGALAALNRSWKEMPKDVLRQALTRLKPAPDQPDSRGFEWWYLWDQTRAVRILDGRQSIIKQIAISKDEKECFSLDANGTLQIWDMATRRQLDCPLPESIHRSVKFHRPVQAMTVDGSAHLVMNSGAEARLSLWTSDRALLFEQTIQPASELGGCCSPDGRAVAYLCKVLTNGMEIRLWYPATHQDRLMRKVSSFQHTPLALSHDLKRLAFAVEHPIVGENDFTITIMETASAQVHAKLVGHKAAIHTLIFTPDGNTLVSGSNDGTVCVWDVATARLRHVLMDERGPFSCMALSHKGNILALATNPSKEPNAPSFVSLWNLDSGTIRDEEVQVRNGVSALAFSSSGKTIGIGGSDGAMRLWDLRPQEEYVLLAGHQPAEAWAVAFAPDGRTLVSGGDERKLHLWDTATLTRRGSLDGHESLVSCVSYSPNGKWLASGSYDKSVRIWDAASNRAHAICRGHDRHVRCIAFAPDSKLLASAGRDSTIRFWDVATGQSRGKLLGHSKQVQSIAFSPDGKLLASGGDDQILCIWEVATGNIQKRLDLKHHISALTFDRSGKRLAIALYNGTIQVHNLADSDDTLVMNNHAAEIIHALVYSPDGQTLASAGEDKSIRFWHASSGQEMLCLRDLPHMVWSIAFSPDGANLAAAFFDGSLGIWQAPRLE